MPETRPRQGQDRSSEIRRAQAALKRAPYSDPLIPAKAGMQRALEGAQRNQLRQKKDWIPAFAGMRGGGVRANGRVAARREPASRPRNDGEESLVGCVKRSAMHNPTQSGCRSLWRDRTVLATCLQLEIEIDLQQRSISENNVE